MPIISQKTWDNMPGKEKEKICKEYMGWQEEAEINPFFDGKISNMEDLFGKENLQPEPKIKTWKDMKEEYMLNADTGTSYIIDMDKKFYSKKLALKSLATLQIAKLIELGYGGMVTDEEWRDENTEKWSVLNNHNFGDFDIVKMTAGYGWKSFVSFHTEQQAKEFMSYPENVELVEQYYMT